MSVLTLYDFLAFLRQSHDPSIHSALPSTKSDAVLLRPTVISVN